MTDKQTSSEDGGLIRPVENVDPADVGMLSLHYRDGVPVLIAHGGTAVPALLAVEDETGRTIANYTAGAAASTRPINPSDAEGITARTGDSLKYVFEYDPDQD